jgi:TolB-like protein
VPDLLDSLREALADRYAVEREVGRGGMATVFLAEDLKHHRLVAIKVLHSELAAALGAERFLREIEIAARLQHPHILPLYDSGSSAGFLYYVMPYVEGESLRDRLTREKQLPQEDALRIATDVAGALAYAHSRGVVHRDIKPENIMLSGGSAVVADFGIARAVSAAGGAEHLTQTGTIIGTPAYMSPEQATGSNEIDGRSDQYSLACVVYEMLVGEPPFTGPTAQAIIARHSLDMVSPPSIVRNTIPDAVEETILRGLSKVPADRYPTAALFAEALNTPSAATGAVRRATLAGARARGRPWLRALPVVVGLALVAVGGVLLSRRRVVSGSGGAGGLDPRHVAVLYFDDLSRNGGLGYLADGFTEALIDELGQVRSLRVISRNGVAPYRRSDAPRDSIARALGVGSLVQGSVEPAGTRVRVTVRLVDGTSGADLNRASFEERTTDLITLRDSLAPAVARFLRQRLGEEVRLEEQRAGTRSVDAWALVQRAEKLRKGAEALFQADRLDSGFAALQRGDSILVEAERLDPQWVDPIVLRGQIAYRRSRLAPEASEAQRWIDVGLGHAERALALAPKDGRALDFRGTLRYFRWLKRWEPDPTRAAELLRGARADLEQAVSLDPTLASAYSTLSHLYYQVEDVPAAVLAARRAYEEDAYLSVASDVLSRLFVGSLDLEQFSQAQRWCAEEVRRFPRYYQAAECQLTLMTTPSVPPDVGRAWALVALLDTVTPPQYRGYIGVESRLKAGGVIGRAGLLDSARRVLDRARASRTPAADPSQELLAQEAIERILAGDKDEAIALLKRYAAANPGHFEPGKDISWWWRDLRDDPRFKALFGVH